MGTQHENRVFEWGGGRGLTRQPGKGPAPDVECIDCGMPALNGSRPRGCWNADRGRHCPTQITDVVWVRQWGPREADTPPLPLPSPCSPSAPHPPPAFRFGLRSTGICNPPAPPPPTLQLTSPGRNSVARPTPRPPPAGPPGAAAAAPTPGGARGGGAAAGAAAAAAPPGTSPVALAGAWPRPPPRPPPPPPPPPRPPPRPPPPPPVIRQGTTVDQIRSGQASSGMIPIPGLPPYRHAQTSWRLLWNSAPSQHEPRSSPRSFASG